MKTTEYLDALKVKFDLPSDYALSKLLDCTRGAISTFRVGKNSFGDEMAVRVAELLGLEPARVLADVYAERAGSEKMRAVWEKISASFKRLAMCANVLNSQGNFGTA